MDEHGEKGISRRTFIKNMSLGLGAVGMSTAFPGLVSPASSKQRDYILIGRPVPKTGPISAFAEPSPWLDNRALAEINKDGGIY
ncbi:MAG: twin-arginine translocation signal domain-containing protein, partial [Desulfobacteraceae bacterium]|nr:twin-arginine translocation signal domain-containing protein [Desulfobacteraceae bacterium]